MTDEEIKEIEERAEKATPGPWRADLRHDEKFPNRHNGISVPLPNVNWGAKCRVVGVDIQMKQCEVWHYGVAAKADDLEFIAHAREDVPALIAALRKAKERIDELSADFAVYGAHTESCDRLTIPGAQCDCGYSAAMDLIIEDEK